MSHLEHLTAEALPLLIRSYDTIFMDEARRTQRFNILWSLCCPKEEARHTWLVTLLPHAHTKQGHTLRTECAYAFKHIHHLSACCKHTITVAHPWEYMHAEINIPLDSLESTAGHVNNASCRSGYRPNQTFPNTFKKACCTLLLGSCKVTHHQTSSCLWITWTHNYWCVYKSPIFRFCVIILAIKFPNVTTKISMRGQFNIPLIGLVTIPVIPLTKPWKDNTSTLSKTSNSLLNDWIRVVKDHLI